MKCCFFFRGFIRDLDLPFLAFLSFVFFFDFSKIKGNYGILRGFWGNFWAIIPKVLQRIFREYSGDFRVFSIS